MLQDLPETARRGAVLDGHRQLPQTDHAALENFVVPLLQAGVGRRGRRHLLQVSETEMLQSEHTILSYSYFGSQQSAPTQADFKNSDIKDNEEREANPPIADEMFSGRMTSAIGAPAGSTDRGAPHRH